MSCSGCADLHGKEKFTWSSGKVETLKKHETSKAHEKAVDIKYGQSMPVHETPAAKILTTLSQETIDKLSILFRNAHATAMAGRPFTDCVWLAQLDKAKGLHVGNTYLNPKSAKLFTHYIAEIENEKVASTLSSAKFVSVLSDGSTDAGVTEKEIVYARVCEAGVVQVN